jgi:hypothetical protein
MQTFHLLRRVPALLLAGALAVALAACHHAPPPPGNATPEQAVATSLRLTATGDFDGLMKNRLPPADYASWRAEWDRQHAQPMPASVAQQKQFAAIMQGLTAPDAEATLARRLEPELARLHGGKNPPTPIFAGILEAALKQLIAETPQLGPAQRSLATRALDALAGWAATVDFSDSKKTGKAIALVCATARALHVQTLEQWRALDYAATMKDYGIVWIGLEDLSNLYGLDLAGSLDAAKVGTVSNDGNHAVVKLDMTLAGQTLTGQWPMLKQDGHWYDSALLEAWRKAHPAPATNATAASAATGAQPAATATTAAPAGSAAASGRS